MRFCPVPFARAFACVFCSIVLRLKLKRERNTLRAGQKENETLWEWVKKRSKRIVNGLKRERNTTNVMCCFSSSFCVFFVFFSRWLLVHHFQCKWQKLLLQTHLPKIIYQAYLHSENSITVRYTLVHTSLCALFQCHSLASDVCIPYNCGTEVLA